MFSRNVDCLIRLRSVLVLLVLAAILAPGCGDDEGASTSAETTPTTETATEIGTTTTPPAEGEAPFEQLAGTGEVPLDGAPDPELTVAEVAEQLPLPDAVVDDPDFKTSLDILIAASHKYYGETIELAGGSYHLPDELIAYDGASGDEGPDCGGAPTGARQRRLLPRSGEPGNGLIAWDESGLLHPLYEEFGDGGTAFIVGHEFAHLAQDRLGIIQQFPLTVEKELNADCMTGGLWGDFGRAGADYSRADIRSIFNGISVVGDQPGTKWQNIHAHGNVEERSKAFLYGFENGLQACLDEYRPGFSHGHR